MIYQRFQNCYGGAGGEKMGMQFRGNFNEVIKHLQGKMENVSGPVSYGDILNEEFIKSNTSFESVESFMSALPFPLKETVEQGEEKKLDDFIKKHTDFPTWQDFFKYASETFMMEKLKKEFGQ